MKTNFKKVLCSLLVVVMCLTMAPLQGFVDFDWSWFDFGIKASAATGQCGDNVYWDFNPKTGELIISGSGDMWNFEWYTDYTTTPFWDLRGKITRVVVEEGVTSIGALAFERCGLSNMMTVILPESVTRIGAAAFAHCYALRNIIIPSGVTYIEDQVFRYCESITEIIIPDGVTRIGELAFAWCDGLKKITIPASVTYVGLEAFAFIPNPIEVFYKGTERQWNDIEMLSAHELNRGYVHYNYNPIFCFMVSSDTYSVDSIHRKETVTYKINLLDENSDFLPIDDVTVQNNTTDIVSISTKKVSDTELELTVEPIKDGDASISLFNGDGSLEQFFNFTVYSNNTTYRADQVPVTNEKLKTNFSRGDMTVDNFEYIFDENKGKYIATMDVYNRSGAIGVVAAYTQDGLISDIEQVDPYVPLPGDFGEFLVYLGTGAVSILKGENWNYRYSGYCQKTPIEIEVPEDGYLTVSCDISADEAVLIYNTVSLGVKTAFKTAEIIDYLGTDTDELAKEASKTIVRKTSEYFKSKKGKDWVGKALSKISKKMSKQFSVAYLEEMSMLSFDMLEEICQNVGTDFSTLLFDVIDELIQEEIKSFGVMSVSKKLIKEKVIGIAERNLMKVASAIFEGGEYINLANELLGTYLYNTDTGKTMIVFKPKGEDGFICKDTIKVTSDIITDEVLLHTYVIKDTQKEDAFVRKTIYSDFNRGDGLRKEELSIDLNRIVEIHEISLWKNGQEVFDTFTATVEMNLPSYIDRRTCSIYRVEKDGTYTKLDTRIEGNKIIFETNHFSEYILTGVVEDLQETTPCDVHVYDEVKTEPSCTEEGSIAYTCYCGENYSETIAALGHTEEIVNKKAATATNDGYTGDVVCSECGELIEEGEIIPATGTQSKNCDHMCHKSGFVGFIWKIVQFFWKLFKINPVCECGAAHY